MEDGGSDFNPNSTAGGLPDDAMDLDFMDEILLDGCWLESTDGFNFLESDPSTSAPSRDPSQDLALDTNANHSLIRLNEQVNGEESPECFPENLPSVSPKTEEPVETQSRELEAVQTTRSLGQSESFLLEGTEAGKRLWIGPRAYPGPSSSVKERLMMALNFLNSWMEDKDNLIQIWVPINKGGKQVLTTKDQPFSLDSNCRSLVNYRDVSSIYNFPADGASKAFIGLPGRVFLEKLPEWTPDVRFFRKIEYPRIDYAHRYDVRGSVAVPVFQRGSGSCLGVVEFVTTTQKTNYRQELESVCRALEAVDLMSSHNFSSASMKHLDDHYQVSLPGIVELLAAVCKTHKFPLAQTWGLCSQQAKDGCRHSNENYTFCVSTVDSACYVADLEMLEFHEACSVHHLFKGEGLVGRAFLINKPVFASDVTAFTKTVYPLSHHARMFGLRAATAIPLSSTHSSSVDFVLEFFLPRDCQDIEEQKQLLNSLFVVIRQSSHTLHAVIGKESEREAILPDWEMLVASDETFIEENQHIVPSLKELSSEQPSRLAYVIEAEEKGKHVSITESQEELEDFELHTQNKSQEGLLLEEMISECGIFERDLETKPSVDGNQGCSSLSGHYSLGNRKSVEKKGIKAEKTITLEVLRQYFAGSLKDAAKSIGVCPTTLKRICRQHGIARWPSRKIKKVGHSLKKLQHVIDSVHGTEGAIQIENFYQKFPELSSPNFSGTGISSSPKKREHSNKISLEPENGLSSQAAASPKSPSSHSSGSSAYHSTGANPQIATENTLFYNSKDSGGLLKRVQSDAELHISTEEELKDIPKSQSHNVISKPRSIENLCTLADFNAQNLRDSSGFRIKATFDDKNARFSLQSNWGFRDLQHEIARRFNINDFNGIDLKYLDDEHEWVLLTCDADLEECIDIHRFSQNHIIKLSLFELLKRV